MVDFKKLLKELYEEFFWESIHGTSPDVKSIGFLGNLTRGTIYWEDGKYKQY